MNQSNIEIIKILLEHGANINLPGSKGNTPLHEAALNKKYEICEFLLENGANQSLRNEFGILPRDFTKGLANFTKLFDKNKRENPNQASQQQAFPSQPNNLDGTILSEDLNVSNVSAKAMGGTQSRSRSSSKGKGALKKIILFGTGMGEQEKAKLSSLAKKLNLQLAKEFNSNGTNSKFKLFLKVFFIHI